MTSLTERLHAALSLVVPADGTASEVEATLLAAHAAGARAWPGIVVTPEAFVQHVAEILDVRTDWLADLGSMHSADLYLACACSAGDPGAIATFEREFLASIDHVLERMGIPSASLDEVKQILRVRFFVTKENHRPRIATYAGRADLRTWVRVSAVRTALKLKPTHRNTETSDEDVLAALSDVRQDLELDFLKRKYGTAFEAAMRTAFATLSPRDRNLLRYYFKKNLSIDQLGVVYRVHRATAARHIRKATDALIARVRDELAVRLGIDPTEVSSILRLLQSQCDNMAISILGST